MMYEKKWMVLKPMISKWGFSAIRVVERIHSSWQDAI
jgi:hypothetical protein